jgi:hypothetical protein
MNRVNVSYEKMLKLSNMFKFSDYEPQNGELENENIPYAGIFLVYRVKQG